VQKIEIAIIDVLCRNAAWTFGASCAEKESCV
jgi:hypothetical protein